jgi:hypothetical protein
MALDYLREAEVSLKQAGLGLGENQQGSKMDTGIFRNIPESI